MKKTINIAGAGISGLTAAIILSKAGYKVNIFEAKDTIGKRFSGDHQGIMNWGFHDDLLDYLNKIGIETNFSKVPMSSFDICESSGIKHHFNLTKPFCYIIQRGSDKNCLDQVLKDQAIKHGVNILFNTKKDESEVDIIATGPDLKRKTVGMVFGYTFETNSPDIFSSIFENEYAPKGYSYLLITNGHGTIATCIFENYKNINTYLEKTYNFFSKNYDFDIKNKKRFSGTGNFFLLNSEKIYVGEAGGFQDFLWGFGIRYAIISGYLSAVSIIKNTNYKKLWHKELYGILKTSISLKFLFETSNNKKKYQTIKFLKEQKDISKFFDRLYNPTIMSKLIYPISRIYFKIKNNNNFKK